MKISHKLTLVLIFGILFPVFFIIGYILFIMHQTLQETIEKNLHTNIQHRIIFANDYAMDITRHLKILSYNKILQNVLSKKQNPDILKSLLGYNLEMEEFYDMFLIDKNGTILYTVKKESDLHKNLLQSPFKDGKFAKTFQKAFTLGDIAISNFDYYPPSKKYAAFIVMPIFQNEKIIGAVAAQIDTNILTPLTNDYNGLGKTGEIALGQKIGNKIVIINKLRLAHNQEFKNYIDINSDQAIPMQKAISNNEGNGIFKDYRNKKVIASWGYIDPFNIGIVIKVDEEEVFSNLHYLLQIIFVFGVLIFFLISYVIWRVYNIMTAQEKLKTQFKQFMENIPANVFILKDERFFYANEKMKRFHKNKKLEGTKIIDLFPKEISEELFLFEKEVMQNGYVQKYFTVKDEQDKESIRHIYAFIMDKSKQSIGVISFDVTKQKKLEQKLKDQEELMIAQSRHAAMGEMISLIAHQWRQPISVIAMSANNILVDIELGDIQNNSLKEGIEEIINQTQYLSQTIDDFRNFFKPNKQKECSEISTVFNDALQIISTSLHNNNIEVKNDFQKTQMVYIYPKELMQVLLNILKNAKEATLAQQQYPAQIFNTIYEEKDKIIIKICNTGDSIDKSIRKRIFEPYFSTKEEQNGTGLGLYMSKIIIEKHLNGVLSFHNTKNGVCFVITLQTDTNC